MLSVNEDYLIDCTVQVDHISSASYRTSVRKTKTRIYLTKDSWNHIYIAGDSASAKKRKFLYRLDDEECPCNVIPKQGDPCGATVAIQLSRDSTVHILITEAPQEKLQRIIRVLKEIFRNAIAIRPEDLGL